jgi:hypothetical protein
LLENHSTLVNKPLQLLISFLAQWAGIPVDLPADCLFTNSGNLQTQLDLYPLTPATSTARKCAFSVMGLSGIAMTVCYPPMNEIQSRPLQHSQETRQHEKERMAKKKTAKKKTKSFEETLWDSANKLRGSVEPAEYKHVVLSLIFLKFASDKFTERREEIIDEGKEQFIDMVEFYTMKNVFYLPEKSRWSYIQANAKQDDLALKIDTVNIGQKT